MAFKDILAPVLSAKEDEAVLVAAEALATRFDASLTSVLVEIEPDVPFDPEGALVTGVWADMLARAREQFRITKGEVQARLAQSARPWLLRETPTSLGFAGPRIAGQARYADVCVMLSPHGSLAEDVRTRLFEDVLFESGRPVLLTPAQWRKGALGRNVVVAWNGGREAARALADAAPVLERADQITVVTIIDHKPDQGVCDDALSYLTRRGLKAQSRCIGNLGTDGGTLLAEARVLDADLIVMGGYGHSRLREFILGGVTAEILKAARVPVLMSH